VRAPSVPVRILTGCVVLFATSGCGQSVGSDCDEARARTVVYNASGSPAYAGQAMLISSCAGDGAFCHADAALHRYGAPYGMNFDPTLADGARFPDLATGASHLYAAQVASHHFRDDIYSQVVSGLMPPGGLGQTTMGSEYRTFSATDTTGTPLPSLRSAEGREILRNWLACRSPVVEATTPITSPSCQTDADCLTHHCDDGHLCVPVGAVEMGHAPTTPNWSSIYATILVPSCARAGCHDAAGAAFSGHLDLSTSAIGYAALVGVAGSNAVCGTRIVARDPTTSYFVAKLEGTQNPTTCGGTMPTGGMLAPSQIAIIRTWITNGAMMD